MRKGMGGSILITLRMTLMPMPGAADDVVQFWPFGFPPEFPNRFLRRSHQLWRVTGTTRLFHDRNLFAGDSLARLNYLPDGITIAVAEVVKSLSTCCEPQDVSLRQIGNMNVIANAGSVGGWIVGAEQFAVRGMSQGHFQDVGDQVRLPAVVFSEFFTRAGGVKIAEGDVFQAIDLAIPKKNFFEHELRFTVGIDGFLRQIFGHGHALGRPVGCTRGTEHKFF